MLKQSRGVIAAKQKAARLRAYKIEHAQELAEKARIKQAKFDAKKLASKKEPKDSSHYNPSKYSPADLKKIAMIQKMLIEKIERQKQSIVDKKAFKEKKAQFRLEHPKQSDVIVTYPNFAPIRRPHFRALKKSSKSAPKSIILARQVRIANAA